VAFHKLIGFRHVKVNEEHLIVKHTHVELAVLVASPLSPDLSFDLKGVEKHVVILLLLLLHLFFGLVQLYASLT
jgi:hypothetical protein